MSDIFRYKTVLLIDNNAEDNNYSRECIIHSGLGQHVIVKVNGAQAIDYLTESESFPELIIYNNELPIIGKTIYLCELESLPIVTMSKSKLVVMAPRKIHADFEQLARNNQLYVLFEKPLTKEKCRTLAEDGLNNRYLNPTRPLVLV